ncbi:MAG: hypothetical protein U0P48_05910 [Ancrocorticia sp.]
MTSIQLIIQHRPWFPAATPPSIVDDDATTALMKFLASPETAEIWIPAGGLLSPNKAVDTSVYPDDTSRQIAESLTAAELLRFDMSI